MICEGRETNPGTDLQEEGRGREDRRAKGEEKGEVLVSFFVALDCVFPVFVATGFLCVELC